MSKVTIEDISRHTGLSRGTVSRALNDRPDISQLTKSKVLDACRQLNYVPSHAARSLATGRAFAVAVAVDNLRSAFATSFLRGVITRAQSARYAVFVTELGSDRVAAIQHLNTLARERVDGVLMVAALPADETRALSELLDHRPLISTVEMDGATYDLVGADYVEGGRLVARRMLAAGSQMLYVNDPETLGAAQRLQGFEEICREQNVDPGRVTLHVSTSATPGSARIEAVRERLGDSRAVAASDDLLAIQVLLACSESNRVPGRDVAVIGQGNEPIGEKVWPTLTTIDYSGEEIGDRAMAMALQRISGQRADAVSVTRVAPRLIERESSRNLG